MGDKKPVMRFNLLHSAGDPPDDPPTAGTVTVAFSYLSANKVTLGSTNNVSVDKNKMKILFDLTSSDLPSGASAQIAGIEFTKPNEPGGSYAPSNVFEDSSTFTDQQGNSHTVFGKWKSGQSELKLVDNNNVRNGTGEQDYGYRVWVKCMQGNSTIYYSSPDPEIRNKPTTT